MTRKRKASISEPLQPASRVSEEERHGFPDAVFLNGRLAFHGIAPITGDGLYRGYNLKGELKHAIVTNPQAHEHQVEYFAKHSSRR